MTLLALSPILLPPLLAAGAGGLFFWLLRSGGRFERPPAWRALLFALLGAGSVGSLALDRIQAAAPREKFSAAPGEAFRRYTEAWLEAKGAFALGPGSRQGEKMRERAIRRYRAAVEAAPEATRFRRELAILLGEEGNRQEALRELRQVAAILRRRGMTQQAEEETALWPAIYGDPPPKRAQVPALRARVEALRLGWFRYLALAALYEGAGLAREAQQQRRAARDEAFRQQMLLGLLALLFFLVCSIGLVLGMVFVRQAARGAWRPVGGAFRAPPYLLWETFLLYFAVIAGKVGLRVLFPALPRPGGAGPAGDVILWILVTDLLGLLPLLYLAVLLRRRGEGLGEIGFRAQSVPIEVGYGAAGYAAVLPWVLLIAALTQWAGQRFFPEVAPPYHPVQALTVAAPSGWARLGLFLIVAVTAPLWEEIFFRGVLYGALRRRFGVTAGCVGSTALFSLLHPQLPLGFLPIFFLGAFLAALYEWRRSLLPGIVLHAINNGLIFLFLTLLFPAAN